MSDANSKRAVAYLRLSSISQVDGHSLNAQERLFNQLCESRGWAAVRVYREEGQSAHSESVKKRPIFRQLMEDARRDQFDIVVVHTLDRWSRNLRVTLESLANLGMHNVALVSITENIDYSTPEGMLTTQLLGSFAQFFSNMLGTHVSKGLDERANEGRHTGGIPFGYESCWMSQDGERRRRCPKEHSGGVHLIASEVAAVREMFKRYSTGSTTLSQLAAWLNASGLRTRNTKHLAGADGKLSPGPKLFTTASVRGILHNAFYSGLVRHRKQLRPGAHEPVVGQELFDLVQDKMRQNSGRSTTLSPHPERDYLLKGIIRCAYCKMPMWAQTYESGRRYYREHRESRSNTQCPAHGGSIPCRLADDQEYKRQKRKVEMELESLVVPKAAAAAEAGKLIERLPELWSGANMEERRKLLVAMLDAVYVDTKDARSVVAIKPKAPFRPLFHLATTRACSGVSLTPGPDRKQQERTERVFEAAFS